LPQPDAGRDRHDGPVAVRQRRGDRGDPLGRPGHDLAAVGRGRLHRAGTARVAANGAVVDSRLEDRAQVREDDADVARRELLLQAAGPCLHDAWAQRPEMVVA
jgi:hypothetical protein